MADCLPIHRGNNMGELNDPISQNFHLTHFFLSAMIETQYVKRESNQFINELGHVDIYVRAAHNYCLNQDCQDRVPDA